MSNIDAKIAVVDKNLNDLLLSVKDNDDDLFAVEVIKTVRFFIEPIIFKLYIVENKMDLDFSGTVFVSQRISSRGKRSANKLLNELCFLHDEMNGPGHEISSADGARALMIKYYPYFEKVRSYFHKNFNISILENLESFYPDCKNQKDGFYLSISEELDKNAMVADRGNDKTRYYVMKEKPFFHNKNAYYELTLTPVFSSSKFDNFVAFSSVFIPKNCCMSLSIETKQLTVLGHIVPVKIIISYSVGIRVCEFDNLRKIIGDNESSVRGTTEYSSILNYLTQYNLSLLDVVKLSDKDFAALRLSLGGDRSNSSHKIYDVLCSFREIIQNNKPGSNILRLLLFRTNNKLIRDQLDGDGKHNVFLSNLILSSKCRPFDSMPFASAPCKHLIPKSDLLSCIDSSGREGEFLCSFLTDNTESRGILYTPIEDLSRFEPLNETIQRFNSNLPPQHRPKRDIATFDDCAFIQGYESSAAAIITKILQLAKGKLNNYQHYILSKFADKTVKSDSDEKKKYLSCLFEKSRVAIVSGPAGTGKTTFISLVYDAFSSFQVILLAQTNAAVDNLRQRTNAPKESIMTIESFIKRYQGTVNVLIIDECSTVSNKDMELVLSKIDTSKCAVLLAGDEHQIQSINFGNWFVLTKQILKNKSVFELEEVKRTKDGDLLRLWKSSRLADGKTLEIMSSCDMTHDLSSFDFSSVSGDSVVLCLNYDGLYGINNLNRLMQSQNKNKAVVFGDWSYKEGDPIIFGETNKYSDYFYNNTKGIILSIDEKPDKIYFRLLLNSVPVQGLFNWHLPFELYDTDKPGYSEIGIWVNKERDPDEDENPFASNVVPFQVSYAVSIHKAQGLEYDNVRVVITDMIEEQITSNIFYTAITRARKSINVYWSAETANNVVNRLTKDFSNVSDVRVFRKKFHELFNN